MDYVPNPPSKLQAPALRGEKVSLGGSKKLGNGARGQEGMKFPDSRSDFILGQIHKTTYMELHGSDKGKGVLRRRSRPTEMHEGVYIQWIPRPIREIFLSLCLLIIVTCVREKSGKTFFFERENA